MYKRVVKFTIYVHIILSIEKSDNCNCFDIFGKSLRAQYKNGIAMWNEVRSIIYEAIHVSHY